MATAPWPMPADLSVVHAVSVVPEIGRGDAATTIHLLRCALLVVAVGLAAIEITVLVAADALIEVFGQLLGWLPAPG